MNIIRDKNGGMFTKRLTKWGLLRRVAKPNAPWGFVITCRNIFDTREKAFERANYLNTESSDVPNYLYKPVEVLLEVEVD